MAGKRYQTFSVTGVANKTVDDTGLESTQAEPKTIKAIHITTSGQAGNWVEVWLEQERLASVIDYLVHTYASAGSTNVQMATNYLTKLELDHSLPVGQRLKVSIKCGATLKVLHGMYEYELGT